MHIDQTQMNELVAELKSWTSDDRNGDLRDHVRAYRLLFENAWEADPDETLNVTNAHDALFDLTKMIGRQMVNDWDTEDRDDLLDALKLFTDIRGATDLYIDPEEFMAMDDLPSAQPVPNKIAGYPAWTIDAQGRALVGDAAEEIVDLETLLKGND